ncbi:hypothetical protein [Streptomyces lunalinharesii]|uniref:Resolvase/invertase-type recombinase catalytic domain-containing protein n=1 Tax=Streptomyces lunalinharesii TaxID=333384 RepID=A0ABN3RNS9_9ACTN
MKHPAGGVSTRATRRPELEAAVKLAGEIRSSGVAVTLVVHERKRLGRGIELAMLAEELTARHVGLDALGCERVELCPEFLGEGRASGVSDADVGARDVGGDGRGRRGAGPPRLAGPAVGGG